MRRVGWTLTAVALLWLGYWAAGRWLVEQMAKGVVAEQVAAGVLAPGATIEAGGFPVHFVASLADLTGLLPETSGQWTVPLLSLSLPAYAPWQIMADLEGPLLLEGALQDLTLEGTSLEADVAASPQTMLPMSLLRLAGADVTLNSSLGWQMTAVEVALTAARDAGDETLYEVAGLIAGLAPDAALTAQLPGLPAMIGDITLAAQVGLTGPLDRDAVRLAPGIRVITLDRLHATWGTMEAEASGEVAAEASGLAEGRILIRITNWRELLAVLKAGGVLTEEFAPTAGRMMEALAESSGDPAVLELPLTFAEGYMSLGPFPLGPAPLLR